MKVGRFFKIVFRWTGLILIQAIIWLLTVAITGYFTKMVEYPSTILILFLCAIIGTIPTWLVYKRFLGVKYAIIALTFTSPLSISVFLYLSALSERYYTPMYKSVMFGLTRSPEDRDSVIIDILYKMNQNSRMQDFPHSQSSPRLKSDVSGLSEADLSNLFLTIIPSDLSQLQSVKKLDFSSNDINTFQQFIKGYSCLESINLHSNMLREIPEALGRMPSLVKFDLSSNLIQRIPPFVWKMDRMVWLSLAGNKISELSPETGKLTRLRYLDLSRNSISHIPDKIGMLHYLDTLLLMGNQINSLPPGIGQLENLRLLVLSSNNIEQLPVEISQMKQLTGFYLNLNNLKSIPAQIGELHNLQFLNLQGNYLSSIPSEVGQLRLLRHLNLSDNNLVSLPDDLALLKNLEFLDVSFNRLDTSQLSVPVRNLLDRLSPGWLSLQYSNSSRKKGG